MTRVHDILQPTPGLGQPPRQFLATLFCTILVRRGRVHCRHLRRACDDAERPIAPPFREPFDWPAWQQRGRLMALAPRAARVSAHDACVIPPSGKPTFGLGPFFNGGARRAEGGLERSTRAGAQPPPGEDAPPAEPDETRGDCDPQQWRAHRHRWRPGGAAHGVEGSEATKHELAAVVSLALHAITTRRRAAACLVLYTGPPPKRRGARRKDAGKVTGQALRRFADRGTRAEAPPLPG